MLKRKRNVEPEEAKRKAPAKEPEYHETPSKKADDGSQIWPAPEDQLARARKIILKCAEAQQKTVLVPDKDADGLSSGLILHKTLTLLGLSPDLITVHLLTKGETIHSESERELLGAFEPAFIFVLDQGSRSAPPLIDQPHTGLVIDHHFAHSSDFPKDAEHVTACDSPPVATSSLLTYELCKPLHSAVEHNCAWLCAIGTHGDLGNTLKWEPPFPDMKPMFKEHTKKAINDAVSLLNAPRRTATFDVRTAWDALFQSNGPKDVLNNKRLLSARAEINAEVERCTHTAPKFSFDAKWAVFRISSKCQVHPLIATRWASHLSSNKLEIVMVANEGYVDGKVNFSCRIARPARARDEKVDIISSLKEAAAAHPSGNLRERMGEDFARGHVQASGGIVGIKEFEDLMDVLRIGEKPSKGSNQASPKKVANKTSPQKNTLTNYFVAKNV